jgi:hypothetical protein
MDERPMGYAGAVVDQFVCAETYGANPPRGGDAKPEVSHGCEIARLPTQTLRI